jgi:hypothetical protein
MRRNGFRVLRRAGILVALLAPSAYAQESPPAEPDTPGQASTESCAPAEVRIEFGFDSATLGSQARRDLDQVAAWLREDDQRTVRLEGYADPSGASRYNDDLSYRRADAVKQALVNNGVEARRVTAAGQGEMTSMGAAPASQQRTVVVMYCEALPRTAAAGIPGETAPPAETAPPTAEEATPPAETAPIPPPETAEPVPPIAQATPEEMEATPVPYSAPPAPIQETAAAEPQPTAVQRMGVGISVGGGVSNFIDKGARNVTDPAGTWDARLIFGTHLPVALEAAYVGAAQSIDAAGLDRDAVLVGNGFEGSLRLQLPGYVVQPYALVGIGWMHYQLTNEGINTSAIRNSDDLLTVPMGLGLAVMLPVGAMFDVRGVYRPVFNDSLLNDFYSGTGTSHDLHTWGVSANLGWSF